MKTKILLLLIVIASIAKQSFAQNPKIDSLKSLLKKDAADTNKVIHLNHLARQYFYLGSYDSTLHYANTTLQVAQQIDFKKGIAKAYNVFGIVYYVQDDYIKALDYYFKILKIDEEMGDKSAADLSNIGNVYNRQGDYPKALDYYFRALKMSEKLADKNSMVACIGNIGGVYHEQKDYRKALDYYFKALKIAEELKDKNARATWLSDIGFSYYKLKDNLNALDYFKKALKIEEELGDKNLMAICLGNIGELYISTKNYAEAEAYLLNALKIDKEIGALYYEMDIEKNLSTLYEKTGRYTNALEHYKKEMALKDTLFSAEKSKAIARIEMNHEFEMKEAAIKAKAEQDKKDLNTDWIIGVSLVSLLLLLLFLLYAFRSLRVTTKQRLLLVYNFLRAAITYPKPFHNKDKPTDTD